jgi:hypothetical protein
MAKGDPKKNVNSAITNQRNVQTAQQEQMYPQFYSNFVNSRDDDQRTRAEIEEGFRSFNPKYDADKYLGAVGPFQGGGGGGGSSSGGGLGAGGINLQKIVGGIDPSHISSMGADPYAGYKTMSQGLRPEFWADFNKYMSGFDTAQSTLGESAGSYRNFMNTGGFSAEDLANMRARALAPSRSIYQNAQDNMSTQMSRAGLNPLAGQAYQNKQLREANEGIGDITTKNEADIAQQVQAGKLAGTTGLANVGVSQAQIANFQTQARTQVEQLDQQMRAAGLGGMTEIEKARLSAELTNQQITQAGQIATNQGILSKAQIEAQKAAARSASSAASAALAARNREFEAGFRFDTDQATNRDFLGKQNAWTNLYGTVPGATQITGNQALTGQNNWANQGINLINSQIQATQIPSGFQTGLGNMGGIMNLVGMGANAYGNAKGGGTNPYANSNPYEYEDNGYGGYNNPIFPGMGGGNSDENGNVWSPYSPGRPGETS